MRATDARCGLLLAAVVVLLLLGLETMQPGFFCWDDNAGAFYPFYVHDWRAVVGHRTLPFLNLHQFMGHTFLAQGQTAALYPPVYLALGAAHAAGHPRAAIDLLVIGHLAAAAAAMFALLRQLGAGRAAAAFGGLSWASFPFVVLVARSWVFVSYAALYLPLDFLLLERLLAAPGWRRAGWLALVKALFFASGYVQYFLMLVCFEALYAAGRIAWRAYLGHFVLLLFAVLPLLASMAYAQQVSAFRSRPLRLGDLLYNSMAPRSWLAAQAGRFHAAAVFTGGDSRIYHAGLFFVLGFALLAAGPVRRASAAPRRALALLLLAALALVCSTRAYGVAHRVPLLNLFRWPFKHYLFYLFFSAAGVSLLLDAALRAAGPAGRRMLWIVAGASWLTCAAVTASGTDYAFGAYRVTSPPRDEAARLIDPLAGRVLTYRVTGRHTAEPDRYLTHDLATVHGVLHAAGYDPLLSQINHRLSWGVNYFRNYTRPLDRLTLERMGRWGVRYLVTRDEPEIRADLARFPRLVPRQAGAGVLVYENVAALPIVHIAGRRVPFRSGINQLEIEPGNARPAALVINVAPLPFYRAEVDGVATPILRSATEPLLIELPAGARRVRLVYRDYPFCAGLAVSLVFWIVLGLWCWIRRKT